MSPIYTVELWDISGVSTLDVSAIIVGDLRIEFKLNNTESVSFAIDLAQFEDLCRRIGAPPTSVLTPYATEVKVKRNGEYWVGAQVVATNTNINSVDSDKVHIRCTGYLNMLKDRYVTKSYNNVTYSQIARDLITTTQAQANGDFGITLGSDNASASQSATRVRNYENQEVKDGINNLTKLENDNFDFGFSWDKVFTTWVRKGSDKPEIELVYPQNIASLTYSRDASTLANKVTGLGSGMGDETITYTATDLPSSVNFRIRERVEVFNDVSEMPTLTAHVIGTLDEYKDVLEVPEVHLEPNTIDMSQIETGDSLRLRIDRYDYIKVDGMFRIYEIDVTFTEGGEEGVSLRGLWDD